MPELQQYEYRDLINVRKEILNRFEWVINEIEQTIENLQSRRVSVADAQQRIDRPLVKEVSTKAFVARKDKKTSTRVCVTRSLNRPSMPSCHLSMLLKRIEPTDNGLCRVKTNGDCMRVIYKTQKRIFTSLIHSFIEESPRYETMN